MTTIVRSSGAYGDFRSRLAAQTMTLAPAAVALSLSLPSVIGRSIGRDSGVFLYAGQELLRGGFPYIDAWDHKGPLLYLLNAAGARFAGGDILGVLLLEAILVSAAFVFFSVTLQGKLGRLPVALAGSLGAVTFFNVNEGGNLTETWTFPFALVAYALFVRECKGSAGTQLSTLTTATIGIALTAAVLIRPTNGLGLGILATFAVLTPFMGPHGVLRRIAVLVTSGLLLALPVLGIVARAGLLEEMWRQYVLFNVDHSTEASVFGRIESYVSLLQLIVKSPLVVGLALGTLSFLVSRRNVRPVLRPKILGVLMAAFVADVAGVALSGRAFPHYLVTLIPVLTILAGLLFSQIRGLGSNATEANSLSLDLGVVAASLLLAVSLGLTDAAIRQARGDMARGLTNSSSQLALVAQEIKFRTNASDTVYVWGAETRFLAAAQRRSASSITYLYPIIRPNRAAVDMASRLETELKASQPRLIVRTTGWPCPFDQPCMDPLLEGAHEFIAENYVMETMVAGTEFWMPR